MQKMDKKLSIIISAYNNINELKKCIDVNVHPTKLEIRWSEEQKVFKAIYHAIRESLLKEDLVKNSEKQPENQINDINSEKEKADKARIINAIHILV